MLIRIYLLTAHGTGQYCFTGWLAGSDDGQVPALFRPLSFRAAPDRPLTQHRPRLELVQRTPNSRVGVPVRGAQSIIKVAPLFDLDR